MIRFIKTLLRKKANPSSKAESAPADETATDNAGPTPDEQSTDADVSTPRGPTRPAIPAAVEVELQRRSNEFDRRFNERQREILDYRAKSISWWLTTTAIFLTSFGVIGAIIGYIGFSSLKEIEATAKKHEEAAKSYVEEIKKHRDKAEEIILAMDAQTVVDDPTKARQFIEDVRENPKASSTDKAIAKAVSLQEQGNEEEALKIWRGIADAFEEVDRELAARAWFSVGYLFSLQEKREDAVVAYDQALLLEPELAEAYNNRGAEKSDLSRYEDAIDDYDQAIQLKPNYVEAYYNRGIAKGNLGRHEDAIDDYDQAIQLKPDLAIAYLNRGIAKGNLGQMNEARQNFEKARNLARAAGDVSLGTLAEQQLRNLDSQEGE